MTQLTASRLRELLTYDSETGEFRWIVRRNGTKSGVAAGHKTARGYVHLRVESRLYKAHRLAWLYVHGEWPRDQIDHINGVYDDNRIANLREANSSQNKRNTGPYRNNLSGIKGVSWRPRDSRWQAEIRVNGRRHYLGYFKTSEEASAAYAAAAAAMHGEFARTTR
jgi:hypothetical protein